MTTEAEESPAGGDSIQLWRQWVADQGLPAELSFPAAAAVLESGGSAEAAQAAARLQGGKPWPTDAALIQWQMGWVDSVIEDLGRHDAPDALLAHYRNRHDVLASMLASPAAGAPASPAPALPRPPRPSLREFAADQSVQIVSYVGAFLLIVATVLFELYAAGDMPGQVKFSAVAALTGVFAVAGGLCLTTARIRMVGTIYIAVFAMLTPLTGVAAYVFLGLGARGVTQDQAVAATGLSSAAVYALLALTMRSRAYAAMSLAALPIGVLGLANSTVVWNWRPTLVSLLIPAYVLIRHPARRRTVFGRVAEPYIHVLALIVVLASLQTSFAFNEQHSTSDFVVTPYSWQTAATMLVLGGAYALYGWLAARTAYGATAAALSLAALSAGEAAGFGNTGDAVVLVVACAIYAVAADLARRHRGLRRLLLVGLAVQGGWLVPLQARPDGLQGALLIAAAVIAAAVAIRTRRSAWLLLSSAQVAMAWYWVAKATLPPPPHPTADTLLALYSPLAAVFGVASLALRSRFGRKWAAPLYVAGAVAGVAVASAALVYPDLGLAGRCLLLYAVITYAVAVVERWWWAHVGAVLAALAGLLALMAGQSVALAWQAAVVAGLFAAVYGASYAWRRFASPDVSLAHRALGAGGLGVTGLTCFAITEFNAAGSRGSVVALIIVLACAAVAFIDGRRHAQPWLDYVAAVVASLAVYWLDRYLGVTEAQLYVALPGATLVVAGLAMPFDPRFRKSGWAEGALYAGTALLVGTCLLQSVTGDSTAWRYITIGVLECVVTVLLGIGFKSQPLLVSGGAGLGLIALRSVVLLVQQGVALFIIFGAVALLLLTAGAALALVRGMLRADAKQHP